MATISVQIGAIDAAGNTVWKVAPLNVTASQPTLLPSSWNTLNVGGGGNVIGMDIHTDGTFVHWGDVFGGWISNVNNAGSNGNWKQLFTATSLPNSQFPRTFWTGIYYIKMATSTSSTMVAMFSGNINDPTRSGAVLISRNKGVTWTVVSGITSQVPQVNHTFDNYYTGMILFNPTDDSEFYIGIPNGGGIWHCTSWGASCTRLDPGTIPSGTGSPAPAYYGMAWHGTNILIPIYGVGVKLSTNSGGAWATDAGAPTDIISGNYASDGTYFCITFNGGAGANVHRRTAAGVWSLIGPTQWFSGLALDPNNKDHLAAIDFSGNTSATTNATAATPSWQAVNGAYTITSGDTPWIGWSFGGSFSFLNSNNCLLDGNGKFWVAMGIGVIYASSLPAGGSGTTSYAPMDQGEEGLQANWVRWVPNGPALLASWDRPFWVVTNPNVAQSVHGPGPDGTTVTYGDCVDYAQNNSNFLVGSKAGTLYYATDQGVSNTWTAITNQILTNQYCGMAIMSPTQWIVIDNSTGNLSVTADTGTTWTTTPTGLVAGAFAGGVNAHNICWDSGTAGKAYAVNTAGTTFVTTNYGVSWSQASTTGFFGSIGAGRLKSVVGQPGHLLFAYGNPGSASFGTGVPQPPSFLNLYFSSNSGVSWTAISNATNSLTCPFDDATTPAAPGQSYPSIGFYGWAQTPTTSGIYQLDMWRCDNFNPASPTSNSMVWTQMFWSQVAEPCALEGNPSAYNQWIIANNGPSSALGWQYYGPASTIW